MDEKKKKDETVCGTRGKCQYDTGKLTKSREEN